ncbi:MAG: hypothetical protein WC758_07735 [Candidatus Woesearchaeota archaeon]|jgi:hypothetical protein
MVKEVKTKVESYTIDEDVIEMVVEDSKEKGISRSRIVTKILRNHYEENI